MKRLKNVLFILVLLIIGFYNVYAKNTVYSINKYKDEYFEYILNAYDLDNKLDGYVLGGNYLKEKIEKDDDSLDNYQVMLVKYNKNDKLEWKYSYGDTKEDYIDYLAYSYTDGKVDGYLIFTRKTYDILSETNTSDHTIILKIDLEGKLVYEKELENTIIKKIIPTYDLDNNIDGYISINSDNSVVKYNTNFDSIWKRDYSFIVEDICRIYEDGKIGGYAIIRKLDDNYSLSKISLDGSSESDLNSQLNKDSTYKLMDSNNGFILYGITNEVKLKKGDTSYYLINYKDSEEVWETLGNVAASSDDIISLLPLYEDGLIKEYLLLYKNNIDSSYEVIKINLDGEVLKKVKKINNSYYNFNGFTSSGNTIYFIGQLNCPEDESCDYDSNSLYLVSDEDKVIEVEDNTSKSILVVFLAIISLGIGFFVIRSRKRSK